ncbi:hypothetical protein DM01DRAFT_1332193 [Hesseltinella vesiculosa]|uniref:Uncharacterized protein n=1 Tax=Hesseltinella vesiculosa TaxID=101127 RepID=A0A1X2GUA5_9FUNG|nr:hypothetical protein DM01DRAFT_1332193 [Hesseltinella vesiculosa]
MLAFIVKELVMKQSTWRQVCLWYNILWLMNASRLCAAMPWTLPGLVHTVEPTSLASLGLPRLNHCALTDNNLLYLLLGQDASTNQPTTASLALNFNLNDNLQLAPATTWINNSLILPTSAVCMTTSAGQALLLQSDPSLTTLALSSGTWSSMPFDTMQSPPFPSAAASAVRWLAAAPVSQDVFLLMAANTSTGLTSSWLLDATPTNASQWSWTALTASSHASMSLSSWYSPLLPDQGSTALIALSAFSLFFQLDVQQQLVFVYCFDNARQQWLGSLTNFSTQHTNALQPQWIQSNPTNDTIMIIPSWTSPAPSLVSSSPLFFWWMNISTQHQGSHMPAFDLWTADQPSYEPVSGGSVTQIYRWLVFYGGQQAPSATTTAVKKQRKRQASASVDAATTLRFWNMDSEQFLPAPSWLASLLSPSSAATTTPTTGASASYSRTVVVILATLLGVFGAAFVCMTLMLIYRHCQKSKRLSQDLHQSLVQDSHRFSDEQRDHTDPAQSIDVPDHGENASTWSAQLQRAISGVFRRKSSRRVAKPRWVISAPLEATPPSPPISPPQMSPSQQNLALSDLEKHVPLDPSMPSHTLASSTHSPRNSWYEGSSKASRFVEHF